MVRNAGLKGRMDMALAILPTYGVEIMQLEGEELFWILDAEKRPCILAGYGSDDPKLQAKIHYMIKFRVGRTGLCIFNVVFAKGNSPVKHTRVAGVNVKVLATGIPLSSTGTADKKQQKELANWLKSHYYEHFAKAARGFQAQGFDFKGLAQMRALLDEAKSLKEYDEATDDEEEQRSDEDCIFVSESGKKTGTPPRICHSPDTTKQTETPPPDHPSCAMLKPSSMFGGGSG